jgi:rhodanese-related sulfurtransferase
MSGKHRQSQATGTRPRSAGSAGQRGTVGRARAGNAGATSKRRWALLASGLGVAVIAVVAGWAILSGSPGKGSPTASTGAPQGTVVQANGGHWTNITPDTLAGMLNAKDFTLLNVKTPYIGEIAGTDLYIPYTDLAARASQLPSSKSARIVVYCRSGNESAIAAQTLIDLGYTTIDNLDGGMNAWTSSGRQLVQLNRG